MASDADTTVRSTYANISLVKGRVSRSVALWSRASLPLLARLPTSVTLTIPSLGEVRLRLIGCLGSDPGTIPASAINVGTDILPDGCSVSVERLLASRLLGRLIGVSECEPIAKRPSSGQLGMLSALMWRLLQPLGYHGQGRDTLPVEQGDRLVFRLQIECVPDGGNPIDGAVFVAFNTARLPLRGFVEPGSIEALALNLNRVPVEATVELATVTLAAHEVERLAPSDVAVFSHHPANTRHEGGRESEGRLRIGAFVAACFLHANGSIVLHSPFLADKPRVAIARSKGEPRMDDTTAPMQNKTTAVLATAPVEITVEVGRISLTGADVAGLCNGSVLQIGRRLDGPVDLTAGGRLIGRGVLVDVEGELGVRLTERVG